LIVDTHTHTHTHTQERVDKLTARLQEVESKLHVSDDTVVDQRQRLEYVPKP